MKVACAFLFALIIVPNAIGQEPAKAVSEQGQKQLPPAVSPLSPTICGPGSFEVSLGSQPLGRESFEIKCAAESGFTATGSTKLNVPGALIDVNTTFDADKTGTLVKFSAKGNAAGQAVDQVVTVNKETANISTSGVSKESPFNGGVVFMANVSYLYQFVIARYDVTHG